MSTIDVSRLDAIIVLIEPGAQHLIDTEIDSLRRTILDLRYKLTAPDAVIAVVVPPVTLISRITSQDAIRHFVDEAKLALHRAAEVIALADRLTFATAAERYSAWADLIVAVLEKQMHDPLVWTDSSVFIDESKRIRALRALGNVPAEWVNFAHRITELACGGYGTKFGFVAIVGEHQTAYVAGHNVDVNSVPRYESVCDVVLATYGGFISGDLMSDSRFDDYSLLRESGVRFLAGYRIESRDGQPIGALCVCDGASRAVEARDLVLVRDLALSAQKRLWTVKH